MPKQQLAIIINKVHLLPQLQKQVLEWKNQHQKIVFTNGCFDILHAGHITYLAAAADLGTKLIVALNTDKSVRELKGTTRPIIPQHERALLLAALSFVDAVILFEEKTPLQLITKLLPDILIKGADYTVDTIVGAKEVLNNGGEVKTIQLVTGLSTSNIISKIKSDTKAV